MHVFVTGATGWIGQATLPELLAAGHTITGLARSDAAAAQLARSGAAVLRGSLADLDVLREGARQADAVVHLAFNHDSTDYALNCRMDCEALAAMGAVLEHTDKPLLMASGTLMLAQGVKGAEDSAPDMDNPLTAARGQAELLVRDLCTRGVKGGIVRLAPTNHGPGDKGFITMMVARARKAGESIYIGEGRNVWPAVHRLDTGRLFALALDKGTKGGIYHAVADEGVPVRDIAALIGRKLNVPVVSRTQEEATAALGLVGAVLGMDNPSSSGITRRELGWAPREASLLEDIEHGCYFEDKDK